MDSNFGHLSDRKKKILKAVIEAYIESGEPVGSKTLVEEKQIPFSSATVRNEMSELEDLGYLEKPHTSSGRIPSETGYRFYVDSLVEHYDLTNREIVQLKSLLNNRKQELESILDSAMKLASSMTNYPALAIRPRLSGLTVQRFELVYIEPNSSLLILILSDGNVQTHPVTSDKPLTAEVCRTVSDLLNARLAHLTLDQMTLPMMLSLEGELGEYDALAGPILKFVSGTLDNGNSGELKVEGVNRLLSYPEYMDFGKLKGMLELFEDKEDLVNVVTSHPASEDPDGVRVLIGRENPLGTMENSSLVFKPVRRGGKTVGAIGIIGPTRMDYPRVMAMINELTESISEMMDVQESPRSLTSGSPESGSGNNKQQS